MRQVLKDICFEGNLGKLLILLWIGRQWRGMKYLIAFFSVGTSCVKTVKFNLCKLIKLAIRCLIGSLLVMPLQY